MKTKLLIIAGVTILFTSCINRNNQSGITQKYSVLDSSVYANSVGEFNLDTSSSIEINLDNDAGGSCEIIKNWRNITLDIKQHPIGAIDKILARDSLLFVLSVNNSKSLTAYNIDNGKFVDKYSYVNRLYDLKRYLLISYTDEGQYGKLAIYNKDTNNLDYNNSPSFNSAELDVRDILLMSLSSSAACMLEDNGYAIELNDAFASILHSQDIIVFENDPIIGFAYF